MLIVGCDPSTKRLAFYAYHTVTHTTWTRVYTLGNKALVYHPDKTAMAMDAARDAVQTLAVMAGKGPCYLFIEEPVVGRGGIKTTMTQAFVSGPIQACFIEAGYTVTLVNNNRWKAWLGIAGKKTDKHDKGNTPWTALAMKQRFPKDARRCEGDSDLIDAAAICQWGREQVRDGLVVATERRM